MAFARVQSAAVAAGIIFGDSSEVVTLPGSVTSGNIVIVCVSSEYSVANRDIGIPTASNITFNRIGSTIYGAPGLHSFFYGVATGAFTAITCTTTGGAIGADNSWIWAGEFSGNAASQTPTSNSSTPTGVTSHDSGTVTPSTAENLIVVAMSSGSADWTLDTDFTTDANGLFDDPKNRRVKYRIQSAATAQSNTDTSDINRDSVAFIAQFQGTTASSIAPKAAAYRRMLSDN